MGKIDLYFDCVDEAIDDKNYVVAQLYMAKLSKYIHIFDDELSDYYSYLVDALDGVGSKIQVLEDEYYEPVEYASEWLDFDPVV